ncbi:hypothetical protein [Moraxella lacunata]|uniref:hypothetical protein n=1 Tax=Moraxella lacunata TaxID=477 RepID=UPI003EDF4041
MIFVPMDFGFIDFVVYFDKAKALAFFPISSAIGRFRRLMSLIAPILAKQSLPVMGGMMSKFMGYFTIFKAVWVCIVKQSLPMLIFKCLMFGLI